MPGFLPFCPGLFLPTASLGSENIALKLVDHGFGPGSAIDRLSDPWVSFSTSLNACFLSVNSDDLI